MIGSAGVSRAAAIAALALALVAAPGGDRGVAANRPAVHKIGAVTWHAQHYVGQQVMLTGYLLARETGYVLFSDEPTGKISMHDLPVTGVGVDQLQSMTRYVIEGTFLDRGLQASNGNRYHLDLTAVPLAARP